MSQTQTISTEEKDTQRKGILVGVVVGVVFALVFISLGLYSYFRPYEVDEKGCIVGGTLGYKNTPNGRVVDYERCQKPPGILALLGPAFLGIILGAMLGYYTSIEYEKYYLQREK